MDSIRLIPLSSYTQGNTNYFAYVIKDRQQNAGLHYHDFFQVCYVKEGTILHQHGDIFVELQPGDIFIVPPRFTHDIIYPQPRSTVLSLYFYERLFGDINHSSPEEHSILKFLTALNNRENKRLDPEIRLKVHIDGQQQDVYEVLFSCLLKESGIASSEPVSAVTSIIDAMMLILLRAYSSQDYGHAQMSNIDANEQLIHECMNYIDMHYMDDLSITGITELFAISRTNFIRFFKLFSGKSFKQYVTDKRINQALGLLSLSNIPINEISQLVGYKEFSSFYRNIRKATGLSPSQYRDNEAHTN